MDANYAVQTQSITLADGAYLEFLPEPLIPHRRARFLSDTRIAIAPTATLLYAEIVQPGRKHHHPDESFGATLLSLSVEAVRPDGRRALHREARDRAGAPSGAADRRDGLVRRARQRRPADAEGRTPIASTRGSRRTWIWRTASRSARAGCRTTPA